MSTLVFVPASLDQATSLWQGATLGPVTAFSVTPALRQTLGHTERDAEDSEYACLVLASVWGLAQHGTRLVLVGQVDPATLAPGAEADNGGVLLSGITRRQVESFFTDGAGDPLVTRAAAAVRGMTLDEAWEDEAVQGLVREGDLLWHAVTELAHLGEDV